MNRKPERCLENEKIAAGVQMGTLASRTHKGCRYVQTHNQAYEDELILSSTCITPILHRINVLR